MDSNVKRWSPERIVVLAALAFGIAAGTYGIANAASGSSSNGSSAASVTPQFAASGPAAAPSGGQPWGRQRSDETPLTGDALSKVTALAKAKVPGGTIVRVETDADGNAAYEAHMVKADGSPATVYVNKQFEVVSVESGMPGPRAARPAAARPRAARAPSSARRTGSPWRRGEPSAGSLAGLHLSRSDNGVFYGVRIPVLKVGDDHHVLGESPWHRERLGERVEQEVSEVERWRG